MCDMDNESYFDMIKKTLDRLTRLKVRMDRITEATNLLPDYIIIPNDFPYGDALEATIGIPVLRADVPDLVAGYLAVPKSSPGPYKGIQTESANGEQAPKYDGPTYTGPKGIKGHHAELFYVDEAHEAFQPVVEVKDVQVVDPKEVEPGDVIRIGTVDVNGERASEALRTWCEVNDFEPVSGSFEGKYINSFRYAVQCDARKKEEK